MCAEMGWRPFEHMKEFRLHRFSRQPGERGCEEIAPLANSLPARKRGPSLRPDGGRAAPGRPVAMGSPRPPGFVKRPSEIPLPAPVFGLHLMHKLLI